jgi:PAS domain S-box-containing protein
MSSVPETPFPSAAQGEDEAPAQARRLQVLFDGLPALIGYWDRDLRNVVANETYVEWFGVHPEEMRGRHLRDIVGDDVYAQNEPWIRRALDGEGQQQFVRTLVDADGNTRHSQVTYTPDEVDGEVVGLFVLVADVTERVEAERQLDDAQELAGVGSWTMVPASQQMLWSREMFRILGHDPDGPVPDSAYLLPHVHPDDRDRLMEHVEQARARGEGYELSYRVIRPDGEVRDVHSRVRAELGADGSVARLLGTLHDVTASERLARELGLANDELRQVNRLNADVLGLVGHDVRQPLSLVLAQLEILAETWDEAAEESRLQRVDKALGAARRLSSLLDDILAMANVESGTIATRPLPVSLRDVVVEALTDVHGGSGVQVLAEGDPRGLVDPFHLRQMVTNLVSNALRYGTSPVEVTIAGGAGGETTVTVHDHGAGVPLEFVPNLFERFRGAGAGSSLGRRGSGFGLYIVGRLAQANGCRVGYSPRRPRGSSFWIGIPDVDLAGDVTGTRGPAVR